MCTMIAIEALYPCTLNLLSLGWKTFKCIIIVLFRIYSSTCMFNQLKCIIYDKLQPKMFSFLSFSLFFALYWWECCNQVSFSLSVHLGTNGYAWLREQCKVPEKKKCITGYMVPGLRILSLQMNTQSGVHSWAPRKQNNKEGVPPGPVGESQAQKNQTTASTSPDGAFRSLPKDTYFAIGRPQWNCIVGGKRSFLHRFGEHIWKGVNLSYVMHGKGVGGMLIQCDSKSKTGDS